MVSDTYQCWSNLIKRCKNCRHKSYYRYGGRGIKVCNRWLKFKNFLEDMGTKPKGLTIERINNNGNYTLQNCCWATRKEQALNRRSNKIISFDGQQRTISQWAEKFHIPMRTFWNRIVVARWPVALALTLPYKSTRNKTWAWAIKRGL